MWSFGGLERSCVRGTNISDGCPCRPDGISVCVPVYAICVDFYSQNCHWVLQHPTVLLALHACTGTLPQIGEIDKAIFLPCRCFDGQLEVTIGERKRTPAGTKASHVFFLTIVGISPPPQCMLWFFMQTLRSYPSLLLMGKTTTHNGGHSIWHTHKIFWKQ